MKAYGGESPRGMLIPFTAMHPLVDACSYGVLLAGGMTLERVLAYNAIAFALQLPFGVVLDACPGLVRGGLFAGTALAVGGAVAAVLGASGWGVLAAVCLGNALFHLAAGKHLLEEHGGRGGPIGVFIATGALGLMAGKLGMGHAAGIWPWVWAGALAACGGWAAVRWGGGEGAQGRGARRAAMPAPGRDDGDGVPGMAALAVLGGLFLLIAWRSWAGLQAGMRTAGGGAVLLFAGAAVTLAGKAAGGYLGERFGRGRVTAASVGGSALLAFACDPAWTGAWLALLFVAQLATGPVLSMVYDRTGGRGGAAFGLNCLGLFAGSLL